MNVTEQLSHHPPVAVQAECCKEKENHVVRSRKKLGHLFPTCQAFSVTLKLDLFARRMLQAAGG